MKRVLDVCCGGKMFYFNKSDERVLFCDKRKIKTTLCDGSEFTVTPDVICDFTNLPFEDNSFRLVVFDPPHIIKNIHKNYTGLIETKYGILYEDDWSTVIEKGFSECFRVLEHGGILIFKWNEVCIPLTKILKLTKEIPIFGHRSGKKSNTHWVCFMKN